MACTSTTTAPLQQTPSGPRPARLAIVPGDPGGPAGDGDDMEPGLLRRPHGVDGALADGAVGAQQGAVEVGGDQPDGRPGRAEDEGEVEVAPTRPRLANDLARWPALRARLTSRPARAVTFGPGRPAAAGR